MDLLNPGVRNFAEMLTRHGGLQPGGGMLSLKAAQAGVRIHKHIQNVQAGKHPDYRSEKAVLYYEAAPEGFPAQVPGFTLEGRIDGIYSEDGTLVIDEIKSQERLPEEENETHFAQGIIYAFISCGSLPETKKVRVDVIYAAFSDPDTVRVFSREFTAGACREYFRKLSDRYFGYLRYICGHLAERSRQADLLKFPFEDFRKGQRELARRVYSLFYGNSHGRIICQAPTGIGKTAGVLFPALKCLHKYKQEGVQDCKDGDGGGHAGEQALKFRRIFYLTARNEGARPAETLVNRLITGEFPELTAVSLTAKERLCPLSEEGKEFSCDTGNCPFAVSHYDNADRAMAQALNAKNRFFGRKEILALSEAFKVCPFELMLDLSLFADVIIGDYNYLFDSSAYLHRFFDDDASDALLLIDEAHELPDRIRSMYSPGLCAEMFSKNAAGRKRGKLGKTLSRIADGIRELSEEPTGSESSDGAFNTVLPAFPDALIREMDRFCQLYMDNDAEAQHTALTLLAPEQKPADNRTGELNRLFLDTLKFLKIYEMRDSSHFRCCASIDHPENRPDGKKYHTVKLHCIDPALIADTRTGQCAGTVYFSGSLLPASYFQALLSGSELPYYVFPSPFPPENLLVLSGVHIDTRYRVRESSFPVLAELTEKLFSRLARGNFMVYFPSYAYMNSVYGALEAEFRASYVTMQPRSASAKAREEFISGFRPDPESLHVGFCVLGGSFSEGLDLPGDRLSGVVIVGTGMPQVGFSNDLIKDTYDNAGGELSGFDCAYFYPGLNKVIQAGGRVIRTPKDRGFILLLDTRYALPRTRRSLPAQWDYSVFRDNEKIISRLVDLFSEV